MQSITRGYLSEQFQREHGPILPISDLHADREQKTDIFRNYDLTSSNDSELMRFILMELKRAAADGDTKSPYAFVENALESLKGFESGKKDKKDSGQFLRTMMLLDMLNKIYDRIRDYERQAEFLIEKIGEIDELLRELNDPNSKRSYEDLKSSARDILGALGYPADKILAKAKDKQDIADIMLNVRDQNIKNLAAIEEHTRRLHQAAENLRTKGQKINDDPNLTPQQKEQRSIELANNSSVEELIRLKTVSYHQITSARDKEIIKRKVEASAKPESTNSDEEAFFSAGKSSEVKTTPSPFS